MRETLNVMSESFKSAFCNRMMFAAGQSEAKIPPETLPMTPVKCYYIVTNSIL